MDYIGHGMGMGFSIWFILILFILMIFYFLKESTTNKEKHFTAQDILDRRYANGEIDTEEYEERSNALKKNDSKL